MVHEIIIPLLLARASKKMKSLESRVNLNPLLSGLTLQDSTPITTTQVKIHTMNVAGMLVSGQIFNNGTTTVILEVKLKGQTPIKFNLVAGFALLCHNMPFEYVAATSATSGTLDVSLFEWKPDDLEAALRTADCFLYDPSVTAMLTAIEGTSFATATDSLHALQVLLNSAVPACPAAQADAILNQATPVQNTWYTVLNTTKPCVIYTLVVQVNTTAETLEVRVTMDGQVWLSGSISATASTMYFIIMIKTMSVQDISAISSNTQLNGRGPTWCRSFTAEVRKTTNSGSGNLLGKVNWSSW